MRRFTPVLVLAMSVLALIAGAALYRRFGEHDTWNRWFQTVATGNNAASRHVAHPVPSTLSRDQGTSARPSDRSASSRISPHSKRALSHASALGPTWAALHGQIDLVDNEDLGLLRRIVIECSFILRGRDGPDGFATRFLHDGATEKPERIAAARTLATACDGLPDDGNYEQMLGNAQQEAARRRAPLALALWLSPQAAQGNAARSIDDVKQILASGDPFAIEIALRHVGDMVVRAGLSESFTTSELAAAWELARCRLAQACGSDSLPVLMRCLSADQCGASSLEDVYRRYEPTRFERLSGLSDRMLGAYRTGDWAWLQLDALQASL